MSNSALSSSPANEMFGKDASFKLEQPIGSMSISPSGRDVVLASKEGLHIIDLDSPYSPPRLLPHRTPWEVADVQWSPFASRDYWVVSTSNQKALLWNLGAHGWRNAIELVLHGHTRAITDINFSAFHADILATCAVDSFVHCWDLRSPLKPAFSFSDWFAGATQVKWSRQVEHVLASSHDKFLHIWDDRKGAYPLRTIPAHDTKIYGIDWNRFEPSKIVTCSLDRTIKFWDTNVAEDVPERVIQTPFPVWRARHTPFGWGLMVMPQRGNGDLHLYDRRPINGSLENGPVRPVHIFPGHKGQVKEFLWRASGTMKDGIDHRDFQLVSWGSDRELKLHQVSPDTFADVGYEKGVSKTQRLHFTRRGARYRTFRDENREPSSPHELLPRTDSMSTNSQYLQVRSRLSTNVGMSRVPISQFRGWLQSDKREKRTGMHGKGNLRKDLDPISWMKNVKIASWDTDTLADELTQVGEKFSKVEFEHLDVSQRKATVSLQGPWGEQGAVVYIRVDFRFPKPYPRGSQAIVHLQSNSSIAAEVHQKLSSEIQTIGETFAAQGRGCIEAVVRYLLHEQTLDQITSWVLGNSLTESKILAASDADDASSDSDDDQIDGAVNVANSSANVRVPLAKGCAALWSETGKLVCFFVPKPKGTTSFLNNLGTSRLDEVESSKFFGGFGRFHTDSPSRKARISTKASDAGSESDNSDNSSMFSSSSSSSSSDGINLHDKFDSYRATTLGAQQRSKSPDGSNKSTTLDGTKMGELNRMNVISIHEFDDLIPAKNSLAENYKILGHGPDVCKHNAIVAENAGLPEVASVWRLAMLMLEGNVPLNIQKMPGRSPKDIIVLAQGASLSLGRKDSGIALTKDRHSCNKLQGRVRWGSSPLGPAYLLPAIFQYFEVTGNIQMLAMLSCIFMQAEAQSPIDSSRSNGMSLSLQTPTDRYFASPAIAYSLVHGPVQKSGLFKSNGNPRLSSVQISLPATDSAHHRRRSLGSAPIAPHMSSIYPDDSRGSSQTPSVIAEDPSGLIAPLHSNTVSLSTSPDDSRFSQRSESSSAFPVSRATLTALAKSYSNSPPSRGASSQISGAGLGSRSTRGLTDHESIADESRSRLRTSVTMTNLTSARRESTRGVDMSRGSIRSILKPDSTAESRNKQPQKKRKLKARMYNQDQFDLDSRPIAPLIPPHMREMCILYQTQYVHLLEVWQLWRQKAEMLQVCSPSGQRSDPPHSRKMSSVQIPPPNGGLEIRRCCPPCGSPLDPIERNGFAIGWHCTNVTCQSLSKKPSRRQACSICEVIVKGLAVPCLQCGHLTCYQCAQDWFSPQSDLYRTSSISSVTSGPRTHANGDEPINSGNHLTCPTGCGCACPTLSTITVPNPPENEEQTTTAPASLSGAESRHSNHDSAVAIGRTMRSHRLMSSNGPDTAISALLSLGNRSRSVSTAKGTTTLATSGGNGEPDSGPPSATDELVPWAGLHYGRTLGKGIGGGLSRGLNTKGSDSTIRKAPL